MVIAKIASLAHSHGVQQPILMLTIPSVLVSPILPIARRAHIFSVVLSVNMWTLGDLHHLLRRLLAQQRRLYLLQGCLFRHRLGFLRLLFVVDEFPLNKVLQKYRI